VLLLAVFVKAYSIGLFPPRRNKVVIYQMAMGGGKEKKAKGESKREKEPARRSPEGRHVVSNTDPFIIPLAPLPLYLIIIFVI
jgi:hypothetical protein